MTYFYTHRARTKGFTLTELAIVLGIIGLILGAIWMAASKVYATQKVNAAKHELLTVTSNFINVMRGHPVDPTCGGTTLCISQDYTSKLISMNLIPPQFVTSPDTAGHPWASDGFHVWIMPGNITLSGQPQNKVFEVSFYKPSLDGCMQLLASSVSCNPNDVGCPVAVYTDMSGGSAYPINHSWSFMNTSQIYTMCAMNGTSGGGSVEFLYMLQ